MAYPFINNYDTFIDYDINEANEVWESKDSHVFVKRTTPGSNSVRWATDLVENNSMFIMRFWEPFVFDGDLEWDEDPFDDWTWQFYFHSLRMVSHLMNAYEISSCLLYTSPSPRDRG